MNPDNKIFGQGETPEILPSEVEIKSIFEAIVKGGDYKEVRILKDELGVFLYEIEISLENGEKIEYNYQKAKNNHRNKTLPKGAQYSASIHRVDYDADGIPYSGECVANYLDGKWEYPNNTISS